MKKLLSILCVVAIIASFFVGVIAADNVKEITAHINYALKMKVDNVEWNPTEADGSAIRPITYNGRTYLPVRALGEKLGVAIDYDAATQTVLIGEKEWTPLASDAVDGLYAKYTTDPDALYVGDGVCDFGITMPKDTYYEKININGTFSTMKCTLYAADDVTVEFLDAETKQCYKSVECKKGVKTQVEFSIQGAKKIQLRETSEKTMIPEVNVVIGDIYMK